MIVSRKKPPEDRHDPIRLKRIHDDGRQILGGVSFLHRCAKGGHSADEHEQPPIDEFIGALDADTA
jgi:hypothetical protein